MTDHGTAAIVSTAELPDPVEASNVVYDPSFERLREFSSELETTTEFGAPAYISDQRSRNANRTKNAIDNAFDESDVALLETATEYAHTEEMVCVDRRMGRHPDHSYVCRLFVPKRYGRIALATAKLFDPVEQSADGTAPVPDFETVQVPGHDEIAVRVLPDEGFTAVLGSDYTGEAKKSFLRLFMRRAKETGGLGLHAGSKRVCAETPDGSLREIGQAFLGLSATGKSTLTAHGLRLEEPESAAMLQDDVCALLPDGTVVGSEGNGLYVKTHGLDRAEQPTLYDAVTHESAVLENVEVCEDGTVDFDSDRYTKNGRAVIERDQLASAAAEIDLETVDQVFFITRNPLVPPIARLSPTQAAAAFMLGESIETSAGDPTKAGESIRVVGTNPFIIGPKGAEGNRFRELIESLGVETYLLNTGHVGDGVDIGVEESVTILRELARGTVSWTDETESALTAPESIPGMDINDYRTSDLVDDYEEKAGALREERRAYLASFEELDVEIINAAY